MTALIIIGAVILIILLIVNVPVTAYVKYIGGKADIRVKYAFVSLYPKKEKAEKPKKAGKPKKKRNEAEDIKELADMYDFEDSISEDAEIPEAPAEKKDPPEEKNEDKKEAVPDAEEAPYDNGKKQKKPKEKQNKKADEKEKKPLSEKLDELEKKKDTLMLALELVGKPLKNFCRKIYIDGLVIDFAAAGEEAADTAIAYGRLGAAVYNGIAFLKSFIKMTIKSVTIDCLYNTPKDKSRYDAECKVRLRPASLLNAVFAVVFAYLLHHKKYAPIMELIKK